MLLLTRSSCECADFVEWFLRILWLNFAINGLFGMNSIRLYLWLLEEVFWVERDSIFGATTRDLFYARGSFSRVRSSFYIPWSSYEDQPQKKSCRVSHFLIHWPSGSKECGSTILIKLFGQFQWPLYEIQLKHGWLWIESSHLDVRSKNCHRSLTTNGWTNSTKTM